MQNVIPEMLAKRRDRCIAVILAVKERECDQHLPKEAQAKLRKAVLDQVNDLYDVALDLVGALDQGEIVLNEIWLGRLAKIDVIYDRIVEAAHNGNGKV